MHFDQLSKYLITGSAYMKLKREFGNSGAKLWFKISGVGSNECEKMRENFINVSSFKLDKLQISTKNYPNSRFSNYFVTQLRVGFDKLEKLKKDLIQILPQQISFQGHL